jgi:hypothetical protein
MEDAFKARGRRLKLRLSLRQFLLALAAIAVAVGVSAGLYTLLREDQGPSVRVITGVQFPYPAGWGEQPLTNDDKAAGLVLKLERQDPQASFLARTVIARLGTDFDINRLAEDSARALNSEIDGFHLITNNVKTVSSLQAVQLTYSQKGEADATFETLMTIIPLPNQTFYLTMRAPEAQYEQAEAEGIQLMDTFAAYVNGANQQQP